MATVTAVYLVQTTLFSFVSSLEMHDHSHNPASVAIKTRKLLSSNYNNETADMNQTIQSTETTENFYSNSPTELEQASNEVEWNINIMDPDFWVFSEWNLLKWIIMISVLVILIICCVGCICKCKKGKTKNDDQKPELVSMHDSDDYSTTDDEVDTKGRNRKRGTVHDPLMDTNPNNDIMKGCNKAAGMTIGDEKDDIDTVAALPPTDKHAIQMTMTDSNDRELSKISLSNHTTTTVSTQEVHENIPSERDRDDSFATSALFHQIPGPVTNDGYHYQPHCTAYQPQPMGDAKFMVCNQNQNPTSPNNSIGQAPVYNYHQHPQIFIQPNSNLTPSLPEEGPSNMTQQALPKCQWDKERVAYWVGQRGAKFEQYIQKFLDHGITGAGLAEFSNDKAKLSDRFAKVVSDEFDRGEITVQWMALP